MKLPVEEQEKIDRIHALQKQAQEEQEKLFPHGPPNPFDLYDDDGVFVCKAEECYKARMVTALVDGKIQYFIESEEGTNRVPAAGEFGVVPGNPQMLRFFYNLFERRLIAFEWIAGKNPGYRLYVMHQSGGTPSLKELVNKEAPLWIEEHGKVKKSEQ